MFRTRTGYSRIFRFVCYMLNKIHLVWMHLKTKRSETTNGFIC